MNKYFFYRFFLLTAILFVISLSVVRAQGGGSGSGTPPVRYDAQGRIIPGTPGQGRGQDSLKHRDNTEDSITIYFRYFDSTRIRYFDSSITYQVGERKQFIQKALQQLPADDVTVITLFYLKENSLEEIAEVIGISAETVKVKLHPPKF